MPAVPLSNGGFANVTVTEDRVQGGALVVASNTALTVQPGGSITFKTTDAVTILGDLIAPSGTISISSSFGGHYRRSGCPPSMLPANGSTIVTSPPAVPGETTFINGGHVTLSTGDASSTGDQAGGTDTTGSIVLQNGSVIDLSSGGVLLPGGVLLANNNIPEGKGGSLSLLTYYDPITGYYGDTSDGGDALPASQPTAGRIVMDGTIESWGFAGGGTLTLQALGFQIGGDPAQAPAWDLYLPSSFFRQSRLRLLWAERHV